MYLESSVKEEWFGLVYSIPGKQRIGRVVWTGLQYTWKAAYIGRVVWTGLQYTCKAAYRKSGLDWSTVYLESSIKEEWF